jgi:hypothetical protein
MLARPRASTIALTKISAPSRVLTSQGLRADARDGSAFCGPTLVAFLATMGAKIVQANFATSICSGRLRVGRFRI